LEISHALTPQTSLPSDTKIRSLGDALLRASNGLDRLTAVFIKVELTFWTR
jgi:hypothetical protein